MTRAWPQDFFNARYLELFMTRSPERLALEAEVIARYSLLRQGTRVADFCCGTGDLLHALRSRYGARCAGVELSADYVRAARAHGPGHGVTQGDALTHRFEGHFDVALNWYSSFGYFHPTQNQRLLENMARHTRSGGRLLLEVYNGAHVLDTFTPVFTYARQWQGQSYCVTRKSTLCEADRLLKQTWTFETESGTDTYETRSVLYEAKDLTRLVSAAGYRDIQVLSTPTLERPVFDELATRASPRLLLVAEKS